MEEKLSGIVLGGVNFSENDKILWIFTLEQGVVSAKIKGVKKAGAKLKFASEPFCFAEFVFSKNAEKRTVIGASLIDSFYPIRSDINKYYSGMVVLEFLKRFEPENVVSKEAFLLAINTLKSLAYSDENSSVLLVKFLVSALKEVGYAIDYSLCRGCGCEIQSRVFFDYNFGGFFCEDCAPENSRLIKFTTFSGLKSIMENDEIDEENVKSVLHLIKFYIENKAEEKLNSLSQLINILN